MILRLDHAFLTSFVFIDEILHIRVSSSSSDGGNGSWWMSLKMRRVAKMRRKTKASGMVRSVP